MYTPILDIILCLLMAALAYRDDNPEAAFYVAIARLWFILFIFELVMYYV